MTGREFLDKINELESCIAMFNAALSCEDDSKLALTKGQENKIREYLNDYRRILLENNVH